MKVEVTHYQNRENRGLQCGVCPHNCLIKPGKYGLCRVRFNENGRLMARNYGEVSSLALDPIEKKPLYHYYPGKMILSLGTVGCNFACGFCQNYSIAHEDPATQYLEPAQLVLLARDCAERDSIGVAYTYSEPLMWYEYLRDVLPLVSAQGFKNVLVTNGYINPEPLELILPYIDAMNVDLKSFRTEFYRTHCRGRIEPVQETIRRCAGRVHIEITTLLITGENDSPEEVGELARWIAGINPSIPLHLSAYHPAYRFTLPATPARTMREALQAAQESLKYVYVGNISGFDNNTYCPECGLALVYRNGYHVIIQYTLKDACPSCGTPIPLVM